MSDELDAVRQALSRSASPVAPIEPKPNFASKYILTPLGNTLDVLDTDLNAVTNLLRPLFTGVNPKLNEVYDSAPKRMGMPNVVPSDLIEKSLEGAPGNKVLSKVLGFAVDVAFSPDGQMQGRDVAVSDDDFGVPANGGTEPRDNTKAASITR